MVADTSPVVNAARVKDQDLCRVVLLNGSSVDFSVDRRAKGQSLLEKVFTSLNLLEKDYFGLFYKNPQGNQKMWLYPDKKISSQLRSAHGPYEFTFGVKFYPSDPSQLQEEITRHHLCLQVHQDIVAGKIPCSFVTYALLASYLVQSIFGDFDSPEAAEHQLSSVRLAPAEHSDNMELRKKVEELYRSHKGQSAQEAELNFLNTAKGLTFYGVDLYPASDANGEAVSIGVCASGILVFKNGLRVNRFAWPKIIKISWKKAFLVFVLRSGEFEVKQNTVSYRLHSYKDAKTCWRSAVEHHTFFRLMSPDTPAEAKRGGLFSRLGSKRFKFMGRTQYQARLASSLVQRPPAAVIRSISLHHKVLGDNAKDMNGVTESTSAPDDVLKDIAHIDERGRSRDLSPVDEHVMHPVHIMTSSSPEAHQMAETYIVQEASPNMDAARFAEVSPAVIAEESEPRSGGATSGMSFDEQPSVIYDLHYVGPAPQDYVLDLCQGLSVYYPLAQVLEHADIENLQLPVGSAMPGSQQQQPFAGGSGEPDPAAIQSYSHRPPSHERSPHPQAEDDHQLPRSAASDDNVEMREEVTIVTRQTPQLSARGSSIHDESIPESRLVDGDFHHEESPLHTTTKEVVSSITVTSTHGRIETTSYRRETDGVVESFTSEQTVTGASENLMDDDGLTQAILKATQLSEDVMVEKLETAGTAENGNASENELHGAG